MITACSLTTILRCVTALLFCAVLGGLLLAKSFSATYKVMGDRHEPYRLCIVSRFRNSNYLLPQWIQYHVFAGVDHFFLLDDCSAPNARREHFLDQCVANHIATVFPPDESKCANEQHSINYLFQHSKESCHWTMVIDADEYVFPTNFGNANKSVLHFLSHFLNEASDYVDAIRMSAYTMSSNGLEKRPKGLVIDNYVKGFFNPSNGHVKTLIKSDRVAEWRFSHHPTKLTTPSLGDSILRVHLSPEEMILSGNCSTPSSPFFLKHFQALSFEDYLMDRGSRTKNSDGQDNPLRLATNPRTEWEKIGNATESPECKPPSEEFRRRISRLFPENFRVDIHNDSAPLALVVPSEESN